MRRARCLSPGEPRACSVLVVLCLVAVAGRTVTRSLRIRPSDDCFHLDKGGVKFPVADAFQTREAFLGRLDRPFPRVRDADLDRPLATPEQLVIARNLVEEADAIARHRKVHPVTETLSCRGVGGRGLIEIKCVAFSGPVLSGRDYANSRKQTLSRIVASPVRPLAFSPTHKVSIRWRLARGKPLCRARRHPIAARAVTRR